MRNFYVAAALFVVSTTGVAAQSCGSGSKIEFEAKTAQGWAAPPNGMLVKLDGQQCGVDALWVPAALVTAPEGMNCKFGGTWSVAGSKIQDAPANFPVKGKMLTLTKAVCK